MSWRGSATGHFDANVPDYQKMLQSRYPASGSGSGWSTSTHSPYSSFSSRPSGNSSLINSHSRQYSDTHSGSRSSSQGGYAPYQPHKYGLASDSSTIPLEEELRNLGLESSFKTRDVKERSEVERTYGYDRQDYSVSPYHDNGVRTTDYSSDSLLNFRGNQRRSNEFELERPAFRSTNRTPPPSVNEDLFASPIKHSQSISSIPQFNGEKSDAVSNSPVPPVRDTDTDEDTLASKFMSPPMYSGDRQNLLNDKNFHVTAKSVARGKSDLTHWQQQQRNLSPREQSSKATYTRRQGSPAESPRQQNNQIENFRDAADTIIREKDEIIEKLRYQVTVLEENKRDTQRLYANGRRQAAGDTEAVSRLQDIEYRNAELRKDLTQVKMEKEAEVEDLEIKLGAAEHELDQLKAALRKSKSNMIEEKLKVKDTELQEWRSKYSSLKASHDNLNQKLDGLERYMSDLPTQEEFNKNAEELSCLQEEHLLKVEHLSDCNERLEETSQLLAEREMTILELEGKQEHLADKMALLTREIHHIKSEGEGAALQEAQEQLEDVTESRNKLLADCDKAKKLLLDNHRGMKQMKVKHQNEVAQLKERLEQEEQSVMALREEVRLKEEQIRKLQKSRKEYADRTQDLESEKLQLHEQINQFKQANADDTHKLQRRFVSEMSVCFTELQSLVQVCVERADGKEPNMSLLLGAKAFDDDGMKEERTLKQWLAKLKELRGDLEKVRKMICDKYAEEMGDRLSCATQ